MQESKMKRFWSFGVAVFMLVIMLMVSGGGVLAHVFCDHCQTDLVEKTNHNECECCHHNASEEQTCYCQYAVFVFEAENTHLIKTEIQSHILNFLIAKELILTFLQIPTLESSGCSLVAPPPLLTCGGRHILAMNATLII